MVSRAEIPRQLDGRNGMKQYKKTIVANLHSFGTTQRQISRLLKLAPVSADRKWNLRTACRPRPKPILRILGWILRYVGLSLGSLVTN
jgi:hypothetical protein